ncbi:ribonuclease H-like domain, reverse transcriptase, RNA-dependent DNA polymerase, partial [Tanacetum coccineum]
INVSLFVFDTLLTAKLHLDQYYVLTDHLIRRIHQLDTTYLTFYPGQRNEFYSLNNVVVPPNNTACSVNSIRRTDIQKTYMAYSNQLNMAYLSSDTIADQNSICSAGQEVGCELCKGPHYTKDCPQKEEGKTLEEAYYAQFGEPYQPGGQYRAAGPGFYQRKNGNSSYLDRRPSLEESLAKFRAE